MLSDVLKSIVLFDGSQAMPRPAFSSNKNGSIEDENEWDSLVGRYGLEKTEVLGEQQYLKLKHKICNIFRLFMTPFLTHMGSKTC